MNIEQRAATFGLQVEKEDHPGHGTAPPYTTYRFFSYSAVPLGSARGRAEAEGWLKGFRCGIEFVGYQAEV